MTIKKSFGLGTPLLGFEQGRARRLRNEAQGTSGLTRIEVVVVLGAFALLAAVAWPALANNRERSSRLLCMNNLRMTGQGIQLWQIEHNGRVPWRTSWCDGGTMPSSSPSCVGAPPAWISVGLLNNAWFQWLSFTNELRSPKILACPSDPQKKPATSWDAARVDGFLNPASRNASTSYFIGLDVFAQDRLGLVAGDRNLRFSLYGVACSSGVTPSGGLQFNPGPPSFGITSAIHVGAGNFLFTDGSVEELSSPAFGRRLQSIYGAFDDNGAAHYLAP